MTRKITVSLPDDVAERLEREKNVSAFVAEAVRRQISHERTMELLAQSGFTPSHSGAEDAYSEIRDAKRTMTTMLRRHAQELLDAGRRPPK